jgi:hypothetical protein
MQNIGKPLKTYGRIVALFKDVITKREAIIITFCHWRNDIKNFLHNFA